MAEGTSSKSPSESMAVPSNPPLMYKDTMELNGKFQEKLKESNVNDNGDADVSIEIIGATEKVVSDEQNQPEKPVKKQYSFAKPSISTTQNSKRSTQPISASLSTQVIEGSISEKDLIDSQVLSKLSNGETMDMSINVEAEANETMMMNLNDITDPFEKTPDTSTPSHNRFNFIDDETPSGKNLKSLSDKNSNEHKTSNIFKVLAERENNGNYGQIENDSDMGIVLGEIEGDDDDEEEEDSRVDDSYLPINLNVGTRKRVYDDSLNTDQINIYTDNNDNDNNNNNNNGLTQKDGNFNEEVNKALRKREEMEKAAEAAARGEHVNANDETTTGFWQGGSKADDTQLSHDEVGLGVTGAEGNNDKTYDNILGNISSFSHQTPLTKLSDQVPADESSSVFVQVPGTGEKDTKECDTSSESPLKLKANGSLLNNSRLLSITKSVRREIENIATSTNENNEDDNNNNNNNNNNEIDNDNDKVVVSDSSDDEEMTDNVDSLKKKDLINNKSVIEVVSSQGSVSGTQTQHIGTYQIGNLLDSLNISQSQMHSVKDQQQQLHKSQVNQIVGDTITVSESSPIITNENIVSQNGSDIASSTSMKGVISSKSNDLSVLNEEKDNELSSNEDQDSDDDDDENGVHRAKRRKTTVISSYTSQPFTSGELKNNNSDNNKIAHDLSTKETQMIEGGGSVSQFSELGYQLSSKEASTYNYLGREDEMNDEVEMDDDNKASMGVPDTALIQDNSFNGSFTFDEIDEGQDDDEEKGERSQKDNENDLIEIKDDESSKVLDEKSCKIDTSIWLSEGTLIYPSSIETIFFKEEDKIFGDILIPKKSRMNYYFDNEQKKMILDILNSLQIDKLDVKDFEIKLKDFESNNSNNSSSSTSTSSSTIHVPCQRIYAPLSIKVGDEVKYMKNKKHFYIITGLSYDSKNKNSLRCMRGYNTVSIKKRPPKRKRNIKQQQQQKGDYDEVVIGDEDKDFKVGIDELYLTSPQGSSIGFKPFNDEFKFKRYLLEMYKRKFDKFTNVTDAEAVNGGAGGDDDDNDDDVLKDMNLTFAKCIFCTTNLKNESKVKKIIKKLGGRLIEDFKEIIKINYDSINNELELSNDTRDLTILKNYEFSAVISKEPIRTLKYLEGLALNWPILSEEFIIDCELDNFSSFTNWDTYVLPAGKSNFRNGCELSLNLTKFINNYKDSKKNKLYDQLCLNRDILQNYVIVVVVSKNKVEFLKFFFYLLGVFKIKFINDLESLERQGGLDFLQGEYNKSEEKKQDLNYCIYVPSFQSLGDFQNDKDGELELSIGSGLISKQMNQIGKKLKWRVGKLNKIDKLYLISWEWLVQCMITRCSKVPLSYWDLSN